MYRRTTSFILLPPPPHPLALFTYAIRAIAHTDDPPLISICLHGGLYLVPHHQTQQAYRAEALNELTVIRCGEVVSVPTWISMYGNGVISIVVDWVDLGSMDVCRASSRRRRSWKDNDGSSLRLWITSTLTWRSSASRRATCTMTFMSMLRSCSIRIHLMISNG